MTTPNTRFTVGLFKEPVSALTHFLGFLAALVGLVFLVWNSDGSVAKSVSMWVYGLSLSLLFFASASFHFFDAGERGNAWLRRFDHVAIFALIAGTYAPMLMHLLDGSWRIAMLATVGTLAGIGIVFKLLWVDAPVWLSTASYLLLGWVVLIPAPIILPQLSAWAGLWLVLGGLIYSLGAVVYASQWPDPWPEKMGHHEVWHLFVLGGAAAHFAFVVCLLDVPTPAFG
ncbi:MAG: hemolysin III [Myxococcota bacterium]|jgi:hemolysin III